MAKIVQIGVDDSGSVLVLDSNGRVWYESSTNGWKEFATYPPGCDPNEQKEISAVKDAIKACKDSRSASPMTDIMAALRDVTAFADRQICRHEETYRGGVLWEICAQCGQKWADDEGGKPEFIEPPEITRARAILAKPQEAG